MSETVEEGLDFVDLALPALESAVAERSTKSKYKLFVDRQTWKEGKNERTERNIISIY